MRPLPPRQATLVLCLPDGTLLGALPPVEVAVPWWQEVRPVVEAVRRTHGVEVTVLRLLHGTPNERGACGGPVGYLAEVAEPPATPLAPWAGPDPVTEEPLRLPYARPRGPAADLAWADAALAALGTPRTAPAGQVRTWNLSSLWRLPLATGSAWLKVVPPFFAHEGAVLRRLQDFSVPALLATDGPRVLLAEVPGVDHYDAVGEPLLRMVSLLVDLQSAWCGRVDELLALGAPDWRPAPLAALVADVVERTADRLEPAQLRALAELLAGWDRRWAAIASCGVPDTLVHGDFHRGNVRGEGERLVLLDWGDCGAGHPLLDRAAFLERMPEAERASVRAHWDKSWWDAVPGSDPSRAAALLEPVAALRQAVIYRTFLDGIEPDERVYHADDPRTWLALAAALAAREA